MKRPLFKNRLLILDQKSTFDTNPTTQNQELKPYTTPLTPMKKIPQEFANGDFDIAGKRFILFTPDFFKYLGAYLNQILTEDFNIQARISAATKNFNALG